MAHETQDRIAKEGTGRHHVSAEAVQTFEGDVHCVQQSGNVHAVGQMDPKPDTDEATKGC